MPRTLTPEEALNLAPARRRELAAQAGVSPEALYQAIHDQRGLSPATCVQIEESTSGVLRRWHLRPRDWHLIWPELKRAKGAPAIPETNGAE